MYELTHKDGYKLLARMVERADGTIAWYEWGTDWELKSDCWVWCEELV